MRGPPGEFLGDETKKKSPRGGKRHDGDDDALSESEIPDFFPKIRNTGFTRERLVRSSQDTVRRVDLP